MTAPPLYRLSGARVEGPAGVVFDRLAFVAREHEVTVVMGPAGTGKSALLRGLSPGPLPPPWRYEGRWELRGTDLRRPGTRDEDVVLLPQVPRLPLAGPEGAEAARWPPLFRSGAAVLLLDEPTRGESASSIAGLVDALRAHRERGAAVVVTHDLGFARAVADHVWLLCAGEVVAEAPCAQFFEAPPNALAARFLRDGNCWPPASAALPLPSHFRWVIPGKLAGMGRPGLLGPAELDLEAIAHAGVTLLVTLTEQPLPAASLTPYGIRARHFPIRDMGVPTLVSAAGLCREIAGHLEHGAVAVHCHAGLGRTGTILAAFLVTTGRTPAQAIAQLRAMGRSYLQNRTQEQFVERFAELWAAESARG